MFYLGIDPGNDGALAMIDDEGRATVFPMKEVGEEGYIAVCYQLKGKCKCAMERVTAMPGNGSVSMFHFGEGYGIIQGILKAFSIPYQAVRPQKWKRDFGATSDKGTSIAACRRLFPDVSLKRNERCRKDHDGMAEALLLAEWARRHMK